MTVPADGESAGSVGVGEVTDVNADTAGDTEADAVPAAPCPDPREGLRPPGFFIAGHAKCGTTALYEMLRTHPQIHMPAKEPHFFAMGRIHVPGVELPGSTSEEDARAREQVPGARPHTYGGYLELFAGARPDQMIGEATPEYLRSHVAPRRIAALIPDARIVAILREPASFLHSYHLQCVRSYSETEADFRKAMALEDERRQGRRIPSFSKSPEQLLYSDHVRYVEQLRRYHEVFPREQVLVLIYDDFRADNEATVRQVIRFLGLDDEAPIGTVETQPSRELRLQPLHRVVRWTRIARRNRLLAGPGSRALRAVTPRGMQGSLRSRWRGVAFSEPSRPDEELMLELRRRFKPEVEAASEYLDRDLVTLWGYDRVD